MEGEMLIFLKACCSGGGFRSGFQRVPKVPKRLSAIPGGDSTSGFPFALKATVSAPTAEATAFSERKAASRSFLRASLLSGSSTSSAEAAAMAATQNDKAATLSPLI